ncbi:MAG TPA: MerR family transcriptional regulator [Mycobacterium sp.]|nr:MerR family transcriptional regulator [Mycobacterium sp.]
MQATLSIGDFARATHMSVKTLRHYHRIGLLEPADVDRHTGYRRYTTGQIPTAQVIRRFRDLDMPLDQIRTVLEASDLETRNRLIAEHLNRLEDSLSHTQIAVSSLRDLLEGPAEAETREIGRRRVEATRAAAIIETVDIGDALTWYEGALGELRATLAAQGVVPTEPAGGIFADELFTHERGQATIFIPCESSVREMGRVTTLVVPAVELATIVHCGAHRGIDCAYGDLATYVTKHALAVDGPLREYYLVDRNDAADESEWLTQVCWPIFDTGPTAESV